MRQFVCRGVDQLSACGKAISGLSVEKPWRIVVTPYRSKRSPEANNRYWHALHEISKATGNDIDDLHYFCKSQFLPPRTIKIGDEDAILPGSSAALDVPTFAEFVDRVLAWAAREFAVTA